MQNSDCIVPHFATKVT